MSQRVSISKCTVRGEKLWRVRWHDKGKVKRKFFTGREAAETHAAKVRGEAVGVRELLASIPQHEQEKLVMIYNEAKRRGVDVMQFLAVDAKPETHSPAVSDVIVEIGKLKRNAGKAESYITRLEQISTAFAQGREKLPVDQFTFRDVETFLDAHKINYRSTLRSKLSTLFKFAVRRGYRTDNPCDRLEKVSAPHVIPDVFTLDEAQTCMKWLKRHPRLLAWFTLSTFAGLRPDEARKTSWKEINLDEGWIRIEAQTTKVRQRRVVYPLPTALEWLRFAQKKGSPLPITTKELVIHRHELRDLLKWTEWKFDVTRHTAASNWIAHTPSVADVAKALGNSESVLKKNYMALVTKVDAEKFWSIFPVPSKVPRPAPAAQPSLPGKSSVDRASKKRKTPSLSPRSP
jgi:integrase